MLRSLKLAVAVFSVAVVLVEAAPALAFDTGAHSELITDATTAEGFDSGAIGVMRVNSWFVDLYEQTGHNPFSGSSGFFTRLLSFAGRAESWPKAVTNAAFHSHFDNSPTLSDTAGVTAEWERLQRAVQTLAREARDEGDPVKLLTVLGMSLHEVEDFYAHTNWVESPSGADFAGADGPGWRERGFGSYPTWFDVPASARDAVNLYADGSPGHRGHGYWNSDGNKSVATEMNKDWPGRPYYLRAAITAYFASRQWVEAVRSWVDDDAFWAEALDYHADRDDLHHDLTGMFEIPLYLGHWQGQGEPTGGEAPGPGGSLIELRSAIKDYFQGGINPFGLRGRTLYRKRFEDLIKRMADPHPNGELAPVPSSQPLQRAMRIVVLRIDEMQSEGLGDPGPDDADMYARVGIDGQQMSSAVISGFDHFGFRKPNAPFTWIKAVPAVPDESEPIEDIEVEVRTADKSGAGTDDEVFLRTALNQRFKLDKRVYDDFERGHTDTYSVPIDDAVKAGLRVGDFSFLGLEKGGKSSSDEWLLDAVKVRVNGRLLYAGDQIATWLSKKHRNWIAPDFQPQDPRGAQIPIWLNLREDDFLYGGDDEGDINPFDNRRILSLGYTPGASVEGKTKGGSELGTKPSPGNKFDTGRLEGNRAKISYKIETITPETIDPPVENQPRQEPPSQTIDFESSLFGFPLNTIGEINFMPQFGFRPYRTEVGARAHSGASVGDLGRCVSEAELSGEDPAGCEFFQAKSTGYLNRPAKSVTVYAGRFGPVEPFDEPEQATLTVYDIAGNPIGTTGPVPIDANGFNTRLSLQSPAGIFSFTVAATKGPDGESTNAGDLGIDDLTVEWAGNG